MTRIEALADAFMRKNCYHDPQSESYRLRNPGLLMAFSPKHLKDATGYRIFNSLPSGYDNLILDLKIKCAGKSRSRLTPENTITDLVRCYGDKATAANYIKKFLRSALQDDTITENTPLSWFLEDSNAR